MIGMDYDQLRDTALVTPDLFRELVGEVGAGTTADGLKGFLAEGWNIDVHVDTAERVIKALTAQADLANKLVAGLGQTKVVMAQIRWKW